MAVQLSDMEIRPRFRVVGRVGDEALRWGIAEPSDCKTTFGLMSQKATIELTLLAEVQRGSFCSKVWALIPKALIT